MSTLTRNATNTARVVAGDVRDYVAGRVRQTAPDLSPQQQAALNDLRRDGFALIEGYWPRERAFAVRDRLEPIALQGGNQELEGGAYLRSWDNNKTDSGVRRI